MIIVLIYLFRNIENFFKFSFLKDSKKSED